VEQDRNRLYVVEADEPVKIVYPVHEPPPGSTLKVPTNASVIQHPEHGRVNMGAVED
jgi:hypothetical protein